MKKLGAALLALTISGCVHVSGGIAPSTIPLESGGYKPIKRVSGRDCVYYLLGIIPLSSGNETRSALASALSQAPGATALVDVTSDTFSQYFIIVNRTCTQVHGTAVRTR